MRPRGRSDHLWSIILAGGEATRLRSLVHRWLGRPKPKQYCAFVGARSMFQHTLDRAARLTPQDRMVTVVAQTIATTRWRNWRAEGAARFSFSRPTATQRPVYSYL